MRHSEEMALVLCQAWQRYEGRADVEEIEWDDLSEFEQGGYLAEVNALLEYLFEHGRISAYLNAEQLEEFKEEYKAWLTVKNKEAL